MRRLSRVAVALVGLLGATVLGVLPSAAPAGASPPVAHAVQPTSIDYLEQLPFFGVTSYEKGTTASVAGTESSNLTLDSTSGGRLQFAVSLSLPSGDNIEPGNIYSVQAGVSISVTTSGGFSCDNNSGIAAVQVDQLVRSQTGTVVTAGFQFFCIDANGNIYQGAMSYNLTPTTVGHGYYLFEQDGAVSAFGNDSYLIYLGDLSATDLNEPIVGMAITPDGGGYWLVASDGGIFSFGDAPFYGSTGNIRLNSPIVGMTTTSDGHGYWLVAADGGIFSYGDARFHGSMGGKPLNKPIVGMATNPVGSGYWLVASDGGIFSFGDAPFFGSTGHIHLNKPVVAMEPTSDGRGYWFVATDGGIFSYGDASFHGSTGNLQLQGSIVGMAASQDDQGYWLAAGDGGIFSFNVPFYGSLGDVGVDDVAGVTT